MLSSRVVRKKIADLMILGTVYVYFDHVQVYCNYVYTLACKRFSTVNSVLCTLYKTITLTPCLHVAKGGSKLYISFKNYLIQ